MIIIIIGFGIVKGVGWSRLPTGGRVGRKRARGKKFGRASKSFNEILLSSSDPVVLGSLSRG